jgi:hypothetical protein
MGDVLHHSSDLKEWYSLYESDIPFGANMTFSNKHSKEKIPT